MSKALKLHLGCGCDHYDGWINIDIVDIRGKVDMVLDLRRGLPNFKDNSVEAIFSNHFFEHLLWQDGQRLLKDCYRVLKPNGIIRTAMPELEHVINWYLGKSFVDSYNIISQGIPKWLNYEYHQSRGFMINKIMSMWGESHLYIYNEEDFRTQLINAGFHPDKIKRCRIYYPNTEKGITWKEYWNRMGTNETPIIEGELKIGWKSHNSYLIIEAKK